MVRWKKALHRPAQRLRSLIYPVQRRLHVSVRARPSRRSAIMLFDPSTRYGGWIDRVKGIVSTYELARLTERDFKLYAGPTFPVLEFLKPANHDWRTTLDEVAWNPLTAAFHVSRDRPVPEFAALRRSSRGNLFVDTNLDYLALLHPELSPPQVRALWGQRYRELFEPRPVFAQQIAAHVQPDAVAVHARFTGLLGDFTDVIDNSLERSQREELLSTCLERLTEVARAASGPMFLFSDSKTFLARARAVLPDLIILPGDPSHIDRTSDPTSALQKTLLDFHVMCACRKIVLLRVGPMYPSAFSRYASYVNASEWSEVT